MGRFFPLRAASLVMNAMLVAVLVGGCSSTREVLATDRELQDGGGAVDPGFVATDAGAPPPLAPDASTAGLCASNECPAGRTTCPNTPFPCAVDSMSDDDNCGACGNHCPRSQTYMGQFGAYSKCVDGECKPICTFIRADCNGLPEDGCETAINTKENCWRLRDHV